MIFESQDYEKKRLDWMFKNKFGHYPLPKYITKPNIQFLVDDSLGLYYDYELKIIYVYDYDKDEWVKHNTRSSMYNYYIKNMLDAQIKYETIEKI